jgi:hypothetical protein
MITNLLALYGQATEFDRAEGAFYARAHDECLAAARQLGVDFKRFVWAVAAISPQIKWEVNIKGACELVRTGSTHYGFPANIDKARRCLDGDLAALKGDKVTRFACNILNPRKYAAEVVIDRHAQRAALGTLTGFNATPTRLQYAALAEEYRAAAREVGLAPGTFQAVVWSVVRRLSHAEVVSSRRR